MRNLSRFTKLPTASLYVRDLDQDFTNNEGFFQITEQFQILRFFILLFR